MITLEKTNGDVVNMARVDSPEKDLVHRYRSVAETNLTEEMFNRILCPNLRTGVRMSLLNPDKDGWLRSDDIRRFLEYIGLIAKARVEDLLVITGERASEPYRPGFINMCGLTDSFLDHKSSSGVLNTPEGFSPKRLEYLKSFAGDENRLTKEKLGLALSDFHRCPHVKKSLFGTNVLNFEMGGMLNLYARSDGESAEKYFTKEDIQSLWGDNKFPEGWTPPKVAHFGSLKGISLYLEMSFIRLKQRLKKTK